ncbi:hypothetical protein D9758_002999 [Tetrapyrgos nigripes]|uniref:DUF7330 domain-containing protein n=1 Tax=Tetrapyrgos nigripes TaxID=182062 RepID=A0A8H5GQ47_9AGAR|nr:hypothetical protein D9758_002999 [Tetrapyrgos nigripes]
MSARDDPDSSVPLLQDDDLNAGVNQLRTDVEGQTSVVPRYHSSFKRTWKKHPRKCIVFSVAFAAALIALLLAIFVVVPKRTPNTEHEDVEDGFAIDPRLEKYQMLNDTLVCPDWTEIPGNSTTSTASFNLPSSTDLTFFLTRGSPITGQFAIANERLGLNEDIKVDVFARHYDTGNGRKQLQQSKACFAGQQNEQGIMIWADPETTFSEISFEISVHLPNIQEFRDISTDFTNSAVTHTMDIHFDLWRPTSFGVTRFAARNASMDIGALLSPKIYVHTNNAEIRGFFGASEAIQIQTNNAPILATIFTAGNHSGAQASLSIKNDNGPITAAIAMVSDFSHNELDASLHTTNGDLIIDTPRYGMSDKAVFRLDASTSNAFAFLSLPMDFQGTFDLSTTAGTASLVLDPDQRDGKGRERVMEMDKVNEKAHKAGKVYWGEEPPKSEQGNIKLRTTQRDVTVSGVDPN